MQKYYQHTNIYRMKIFFSHPAFLQKEIYKDGYPVLCLMRTLPSTTRQAWLQLIQVGTEDLRPCVPLSPCVCVCVQTDLPERI